MRFLVLLAIVAAVALCALHPGAVFIGTDEHQLLTSAADANAHHQLADQGLSGSLGHPYGPLPTQFYQAMLLLTKNTQSLIVIRAILFSAIIAASLWIIGGQCKLGQWFIPIVLAAPM